MATKKSKTFTVAELGDLGVLSIGSFDGIHLGATLEGTGMTSGNSDYKLLQSIDGTNWIDIPGGVFTDLANEVLPVSLPNVFTMLFLGVQMTSIGTETTGSVIVNAVTQS